VLRKIFGPKKDKISRHLRISHDKLCDVYRSPNIVRIVKSRRLLWAGYGWDRRENNSKRILGEKPSWKVTIWKTKKEMDG
jgi:hypothetical protein